MLKQTVQIGTVSEGTLRNEDLVPVFIAEQRALVGDEETEYIVFNEVVDPAAIIEPVDDIDWDIYSVDELIDALNENRPHGFVYFGTLEGDGAAFGWWPDHEEIERAIEEGEFIDWLSNHSETVTVNRDYGVKIHVNDHGNVTITSLDSGDVLLELV